MVKIPNCKDCKDQVIDYSKPEETPRWIIIPVFNSNQCQDGSFRQWWLSQEQGIRARGCRKKGSTKMSLQSYLFQKSKGWTMARAKEWVAQHKRSQALEAFKNYLWRG